MTQYVRVYFDASDVVVHVETTDTPFKTPFIVASNISYIKECELDDVVYTEAELKQLYESLGFDPTVADEAIAELKMLSEINQGREVEPDEPAIAPLSLIRLSYDGKTLSIREFRRARELFDNMETDGTGGVRFKAAYTRNKTVRNVRDAKDPTDPEIRRLRT